MSKINFKNSTDYYGVISKLFHWSTALIILGLLLVGYYFDRLSYGSLQFTLLSYHKSFGLLILWLVALRIVWHRFSKKPASLPTHKKWEIYLAKTVHGLLYIALIGMPLSGWIMSMSGGHSVSFFGLVMPTFIEKNESINDLSWQFHQYTAYMLVFAFFLHSVGAFKHHFIDRDTTLARMAVAKGLWSAYIAIIVFFIFWTLLAWIWFG